MTLVHNTHYLVTLALVSNATMSLLLTTIWTQRPLLQLDSAQLMSCNAHGVLLWVSVVGHRRYLT